MRLAWSGFEEWLEAIHAASLPKYNDTIRAMYKVRQNHCRATHDAAMADESCQIDDYRSVPHLPQCFET